ncbi:MAG: metallophosphoesterase [Sporomusaceae bacterium]|nr:metallophosphoesterase [Sporomusaceae bacterium]
MEDKTTLLQFLKGKQDQVTRRNFLKSCGLSVLALGLPLHFTKEVFAAEETLQLEDRGLADHITLTWAEDPKTTQTILWRSKEAVTGVVQYLKTSRYKKQGWQDAATIQAISDRLSTNLGDMNLQFVTLQKLAPGTSYTYRVGDGTSWGDAFTFQTEPEKEQAFKFLLFGDSQSGLPKEPEYGPWQKTLHNAYEANQDAAFMMVVGDLVEVGQNQYAHWNHWYEAAKGVIEKLPHMAVSGNHETYDTVLENHSTKALYFTKQEKLPGNGPEELLGEVYSFDYGNVHFAVINSQENEEGQYVPDMLAKEALWLDEDLSKSNKPWKIVLFHKTPYYNKATRANENVKAAFLPVFDKHHVDVVFNGHDHAYSRTYPIYQDSFVASPAKGTVYVVTGRSGNKYYTDLSNKMWNAFFFDPQAEPNYLVVKVDGAVLTIEAYEQSGTLIDRYSINKATGKDLPVTVLPQRSNDTRLVIWGNLVQTPLLSAKPQQIAGNWYIPLRSFVEFIGGAIQASGGKVQASYGKNSLEFEANSTAATLNGQSKSLKYPLVKQQGVSLLAADDVHSLFGFSYKYDTSLNMIFFAK